MSISKPCVAVVATVAIAGCADTPLSDADYGSSVKQMVQAQTFDPAAASNPPELGPEMTDGDRLKNALDVYRKDVAKGNTEVKRPIVFEVDE
jgi:type IV pilus biogenesis protein CpaD/CtpE